MFKLISWLIIAPLVVAAAVFSVVNRQVHTLDLWPLPLSVELPVYALILGALFFGVLWGGIAAWISAGKTRARARQLARQLETSERDRLYLSEQLRKAREELHPPALEAQPKAAEKPVLAPPDAA